MVQGPGPTYPPDPGLDALVMGVARVAEPRSIQYSIDCREANQYMESKGWDNKRRQSMLRSSMRRALMVFPRDTTTPPEEALRRRAERVKLRAEERQEACDKACAAAQAAVHATHATRSERLPLVSCMRTQLSYRNACTAALRVATQAVSAAEHSVILSLHASLKITAKATANEWNSR